MWGFGLGFPLVDLEVTVPGVPGLDCKVLEMLQEFRQQQ